MMLVKRASEPEAMRALKKELAGSGAVRVTPAFPEAAAVALLRALKGAEHTAFQRVHPSEGFQIWRFGFEPGVGCDHPLCILGRWLRGEGLAWFAALTGTPPAAPASAMMVSERARKSSFCDPYEARTTPGAAYAVRVHFTQQAWPAAWGGHLEATHRGRATTWAPAWNALDVLDLRGGARWRSPLIDRHVDGYTITTHFEASQATPKLSMDASEPKARAPRR